MPKVEEEWGLKLCLGYRDFLAGGVLSDNIVEAIEASRKVILLITPAFTQS
jgi:phosphoribosylanthranilate isomerase